MHPDKNFSGKMWNHLLEERRAQIARTTTKENYLHFVLEDESDFVLENLKLNQNSETKDYLRKAVEMEFHQFTKYPLVPLKGAIVLTEVDYCDIEMFASLVRYITHNYGDQVTETMFVSFAERTFRYKQKNETVSNAKTLSALTECCQILLKLNNMRKVSRKHLSDMIEEIFDTLVFVADHSVISYEVVNKVLENIIINEYSSEEVKEKIWNILSSEMDLEVERNILLTRKFIIKLEKFTHETRNWNYLPPQARVEIFFHGLGATATVRERIVEDASKWRQDLETVLLRNGFPNISEQFPIEWLIELAGTLYPQWAD